MENLCTNPALRQIMSNQSIGSIMARLGFKSEHGRTGNFWLVVEKSGAEVAQYSNYNPNYPNPWFYLSHWDFYLSHFWTRNKFESMPNQYSKRAIAHLYFPDAKPESAEKRLMVWIKQCKGLMEQLQADGYKSRSWGFTPKQKELIFEYLGDP